MQETAAFWTWSFGAAGKDPCWSTSFMSTSWSESSADSKQRVGDRPPDPDPSPAGDPTMSYGSMGAARRSTDRGLPQLPNSRSKFGKGISSWSSTTWLEHTSQPILVPRSHSTGAGLSHTGLPHLAIAASKQRGGTGRQGVSGSSTIVVTSCRTILSFSPGCVSTSSNGVPMSTDAGNSQVSITWVSRLSGPWLENASPLNVLHDSRTIILNSGTDRELEALGGHSGEQLAGWFLQLAVWLAPPTTAQARPALWEAQGLMSAANLIPMRTVLTAHDFSLERSSLGMEILTGVISAPTPVKQIAAHTIW